MGNASMLVGFLLIAGMKLVLISDHEIVASDRRHDDLWQILSAAQWYWDGPYDQWTLMHLPIYPLFIATTGATGIPLRLSIELTYLAGAATVILALGRLGVPRALQLASFALIVFHPNSFNGFDFALAETLYACLMLLFVAVFIRVITAQNSRDFHVNVILFAGVTALMWYCRKESVLIGVLLGFVTITVLTACVFKAVTKRESQRLVLGLVVAPLVAVVASGAMIAAANGRIYGLWHTNQFAAPNYLRAYASLQSIRPDHPIRFVPVTREMRLRAYAVSPAFRELQPILDGEAENWGAYWTRTSMGIEGEIGAGWFYWTLIDAAARTGHFTNGREAESFFGRIADEITAALADGRLPSRRVILPYLDPSFALWLPGVPESFLKLTRRLWPASLDDFSDRPKEVTATATAAFDSVANRRVAAGKEPIYRVLGWALSSGPQPTSIMVTRADGEPVPVTFAPQPRPDVPTLRDPTGRPGPPAVGFTIDWSAKPISLSSLRYKVLLEGGGSALSPSIATVPVARPITLSSTVSGSTVLLAIDRMDTPRGLWQSTVAEAIAYWYPTVLSAFALVCVCLSLFSWSIGRRPLAWANSAVFLFVLAIISERLLFFALLDASAWNGDQARYIFPVATLAAIAPALLYTVARPRGGLKKRP